MQKPYMENVSSYKKRIDSFGGLNRLIRTNENEFSDMTNMSSDSYPILSPRKKRAIVKTFNYYKPTGILCKDAFVFTTEKNDSGIQQVYINDHGFQNGISISQEYKGERTIVGMGAYAVVFPDKFYVNLNDLTDHGYLFQKTEYIPSADIPIKLCICTREGEDFEGATISSTEPSDKKAGTVWVDTSQTTSALKIWDASTKQWVQQATTYIKISYPGIADGFSKYDGVSISGLSGGSKNRVKKQVKALNADGVILWDVKKDVIDKNTGAIAEGGTGYLIVAGILDEVVSVGDGETKITIERKVPDMDFVCERNNRLWGCKYGVVGDKVVNEIYACKQGDFKNWNSYLGVSTDSFAASVGSDGPFTGIVNYGDNVLFFKQDCIHKLYGTIPSNFQLIKETCPGVAKGHSKSLTIVDDVLYYKSPLCFMAYMGSSPISISEKLGRTKYQSVIAGRYWHKAYFSCTKENGEKELLVYDTEKDLWHKEDNRNILFFADDGHVLYFVADNGSNYTIESVNDDYNTLLKASASDKYPVYEDNFEWSFETGDFGMDADERQYLKSIVIRAKKSLCAWFKVFISYDGADYVLAGTQTSDSLRTVKFRITPQRRCELFRIKIVGSGEVDFISLTLTLGQGSDEG